MNKLILFTLISLFTLSNKISADGGAIGLQLGKITFGLGSSSKGPIIGIGPSPDNHLPISLPFVPGDCNCNKINCNNCTR
jgi:hypothetical protein